MRWNHRQAGVDQAHRLFNRCDIIGPHRRCRGKGGFIAGSVGYPELFDCGDGFQRLANFFAGVAGEDAAVDIGGGALRQGVWRVPGADHGGHASGADLANERWIGAQHLERPGVVHVHRKSAHCGGQPGVAFKAGGLDEIGLGQAVLFGLELIFADILKRPGQLDNGVVSPGGRAVAAGIGHFELVIVIGFFRAFPCPVKRLAGLFVKRTAHAVDVDDEFGILQFSGDHLAGRHRGFFIAGKFEHDRPARGVARPAHFDQRCCGESGIELHVARPAAEQHAVFDYRGERIALPVFGIGLDHIKVA